MSACGVCLFVRPSVTFVNCAKTNKDIFEIFHHRVAKPFWFFRAKRDGDIPTGTPLTGASNAGGVCKKRISGRISGFAAYRSTVLSTVRVAKCKKQSATNGGVRRPLFAQDDDEVFMTGSTLYADTPKRRSAPPPVHNPLVITPIFCCRRTS